MDDAAEAERYKLAFPELAEAMGIGGDSLTYDDTDALRGAGLS